MDFDPYETWLGIPTDRRPPTYYDLLGVAPDESDQAVIEKAGCTTRRMSNVRASIVIGPHSERSQEVLNELARARLILMDPDRRADYDAKLAASGKSVLERLAVPEKVGKRRRDATSALIRRPCRRRVRLTRADRAVRRRVVDRGRRI